MNETARVHPLAVVDPGAILGEGVDVGPYAVVGKDVTVGPGTTIGPHAVLEGPATVGPGNTISGHAFLGGPPQDLKYKGERTTLVIGSRNVFREFVTVHRGTVTGHGTTVIGDDNLFMAYSHVAHDCVVGHRCVFANGASLAGHVTIEDDVILGAFAAVRQFLRVGRHAFVGAFAPLNKNVLPFLWTSADRPTKAWKLNAVGLSRKGFLPETITALQKAYRVLHRHRHDREAMLRGLDALAAESGVPEVREMAEFVRSSSKEGVHGA